jgi:uncharacterized protein YgbK (DUF1537 family)
MLRPSPVCSRLPSHSEGTTGVRTIAALADDLTGALEVGAKFAASGIPASVSTTLAWDHDAPVSVIDTETRHVPPAQASEIVNRLAREAAGVRLLYKKTDSTLRGNIGAELAALAAAFPGTHVAFSPAYPLMGRTVRNGMLLVHGVPVSETEFARDPLNPVRVSHVPSLVGECVQVFDAETDVEVARIACDLLSRGDTSLAAGPAALAEAIAARIEVPRTPVPPFPKARRCLVVNGSLHPLSIQQAAMACDADWMIVHDGRPGVGERVRALVNDFDALVIFGGDTAFAILRALECPVLRPVGEIVPGVPLSRGRCHGRDMIIMTKAGGFGPVDILASIRHLL